jgi:hypothetical protein
MVEFSPAIAATDATAATRANTEYFIPNGPETDPDKKNKGVIPVGKAFGVWAWHTPATTPTTPVLYEFNGTTVTKHPTPGEDGQPDTADDGTKYDYGTPKPWPINPSALSFLAYYPVIENSPITLNNAKVTGTTPEITLTYATPTEGSEQIDVMWAAQSETQDGENPVPLKFHHALSRVTFKGQTRGFDTDTGVKIKAIELIGVALKGSLTVKSTSTDTGSTRPVWTLTTTGEGINGDIEVDQLAWTNPEAADSDDRVTEELDEAAATGFDNAKGLVDTNGDLLLIPQSLAPATLHVTASVTSGDAGAQSVDKDYYIPLTAVPDLEMNLVYTLVITLTPHASELNALVSPWNDDDHPGDYKEQPQHTLKVNRSVFEFDSSAGEKTLSVTSDLVWEISSPITWVTGDSGWLGVTNPTPGTPVNGASGANNVTLAVDDNLTFVDRKATFDIVTKLNNTERIRKTITVKQGKYVWSGRSADILYWDETDQMLKVGHWGKEPDGTFGPVTSKNMIFTKFGSVVGFIADPETNGTGWSSSRDIKFNPTTTPTASMKWGNSTHTSLPNNIPNAPEDWYNYATLATASVSDPEYHNFDNVYNNGRGDICRLVGISKDKLVEIAALPDADSRNAALNKIDQRWRLPTALENHRFVGDQTTPSAYGNSISINNRRYWVTSSTTVSSPEIESGKGARRNGAYFPFGDTSMWEKDSEFLPAAGFRNTIGAVNSQGSHGGYWSSTPYSNPYGCFLYFYNGEVRPSGFGNYGSGFAVRCVRP